MSSLWTSIVAEVTKAPLGTALALGSAGVGVASGLRAGQAAQAATDFERNRLLIQADRDKQIAALEAKQFEEDETRRLISTSRISTPGLESTTGTALLNEQAILSAIQKEADLIFQGGEVSAAHRRTQAIFAELRGSAAETQSFLTAGTSVLSAARAFT